MYRLAQFGLLLLAAICMCGVIFGGAGLMIAFQRGGSPQMLVMLLVTLVGLAGAGACLWKSKQLSKAKAQRIAELEFTGSRLEADVRKPMLVLLLLLAVPALLFPTVLAYFTPSVKMIAFAVVCLPCAVFLLAAITPYFRSGKPALVMDGYALDHAWYGPIRWDQIHGIHLRRIVLRNRPQYTLMLGVAKPGKYLAQQPWALRLFHSRKRREASTGDLSIPLTVLNQPAELIYKAALELRGRVSPPLQKFWYPGMSAEEAALQRQTEETLARLEQIGTKPQPGQSAAEIARDTEEVQRLADTLDRQVKAGKPFLEQKLARLQRGRRIAYLFLALTLAFFALRIWVIAHRH